MNVWRRPDAAHTQNGWNEYQKLVLSELQRHTEELVGLRTEVAGLRTAMEVVKLKVGLIGVTAGLVAGGVASAVVTTLLK